MVSPLVIILDSRFNYEIQRIYVDNNKQVFNVSSGISPGFQDFYLEGVQDFCKYWIPCCKAGSFGEEKLRQILTATALTK